jgi:hypothetical protein
VELHTCMNLTTDGQSTQGIVSMGLLCRPCRAGLLFSTCTFRPTDGARSPLPCQHLPPAMLKTKNEAELFTISSRSLPMSFALDRSAQTEQRFAHDYRLPHFLKPPHKTAIPLFGSQRSTQASLFHFRAQKRTWISWSRRNA